jgi:16S rRNA (uracil1498-N3)-methyltransferase
MADRYFAESPIKDSSARLAGGEAHHLAHVMRAKPGDEVTLFDGSGAEFAARVTRVGRADIELEILARRDVNRELLAAVALGAALPKGERARWLVEKATELGVARLVPLETHNGNECPSAAAIEKLRRAVIEASKQCGRNRLLEISEPQPLVDFLAATDKKGARLIAHPGGGDFRATLDGLTAALAAAPIALVVGPEGGFTRAEIGAAQSHGWRTVDLGPRVLRVETAALVLVSAVVTRLDQPARS